MESKKQVIVVSLPGESDPDYHGFLKHLADIYIAMDGLTDGKDHLVILHDKTGRRFLNRHEFRNARLIQVDKPSLDMWMRDFPPAVPEVMAKFRYKPGYLKSSEAKSDQSRFDKFAEQIGLPVMNQENLILEGGNIVDNGKDIALVSDPEDTTGHSDGVVSFVEENVLLVAYYSDDPEYFDMIEHEVKKHFPRVHVLPLPCYEVKKKSYGFGTSEGSYANSLVTYNAVYVPMFSNQTSNKKALEVFQSNTSKIVVGVPGLDKVAKLGGSIRCMTWQIDQDHPIARTLLEYAEGSSSDDQDYEDDED